MYRTFSSHFLVLFLLSEVTFSVLVRTRAGALQLAYWSIYSGNKVAVEGLGSRGVTFLISESAFALATIASAFFNAFAIII